MIKLAKLDNKPEIFHSIQGEGKNMGKPSVFIRLSLCNLYCRWCDTDYTWNWLNTPYLHNNDALPGYTKYRKEDMMLQMGNEEITALVAAFNCNNLVITGGEPLVQVKDLQLLLATLKQSNPAYHIEFETNGTLIPTPQVDALADQYNVSVKLSNSGVDKADRLRAAAIDFFAASDKSNFKFVVDDAADLAEVLEIINTHRIASHNVYLMPQGTTIETLKSKQAWIAEICKQYNFNYTDRFHIHIWGNKRFV
jgi:organic radical activating enzyme